MRIRMISGTYGYRSSEGIMEAKDERSGEFEVGSEEGRRLIDMGYAVSANSPDMPEETGETDTYAAELEQLMDMNKRELEKLAKDLGLAGSGTKEELAERIVAETVNHAAVTEGGPSLIPAEPEE